MPCFCILSNNNKLVKIKNTGLQGERMMKKEIEKAIHNLAVEGITIDAETMEIIKKYENDEISFEEFKLLMLEKEGN